MTLSTIADGKHTYLAMKAGGKNAHLRTHHGNPGSLRVDSIRDGIRDSAILCFVCVRVGQRGVIMLKADAICLKARRGRTIMVSDIGLKSPPVEIPTEFEQAR
jgi:hypothetical protein